MRCVILSPYFPPDRGGVSDHSAIMAAELQRLGHEVAVLTHAEDAQAPEGVRIVSIPRASKGRWLEETVAARPDLVLLQFTPLAYAENFYGIGPWLPWLMLRLRHTLRKPLWVFAHESHYPVGLNARGICIGLPHFVQFFALAALADRVLFSHEATRAFWSHALFWKKSSLAVVPVTSNIRDSARQGDAREAVGLPADSEFLLYFGGAHDTNLLSYALEAHRELRKRHPEAYLVMAGVGEPDLRRAVPGGWGEGVVVTGYLPEAQISALFRDASVVLAPFSEGVSTRRGSVMAGLLHGKALVTTRGYGTRDDHPWHTFVAWSSSGDRGAYVREVGDLFADSDRRRALGEAAKNYYDANFSARATAARLLSFWPGS